MRFSRGKKKMRTALVILTFIALCNCLPEDNWVNSKNYNNQASSTDKYCGNVVSSKCEYCFEKDGTNLDGNSYQNIGDTYSCIAFDSSKYFQEAGFLKKTNTPAPPATPWNLVLFGHPQCQIKNDVTFTPGATTTLVAYDYCTVCAGVKGPNDPDQIDLKSVKVKNRVFCVANCDWQVPGYNVGAPLPMGANDVCPSDVCTDTKCRFCYQSTNDPNPPAKFCVECDYSVNRFSNLVYGTIQNYLIPDDTKHMGCSTAAPRSATVLSLTYFIDPTASSCRLASCTGSYASPFDDIAWVAKKLYYLDGAGNQNIGQYSEITVKIYLMKGTHYFLDKYITGANTVEYSFLKADSNLPMFTSRLFERVSAAITLQPAVINVDGCVDSTKCFTSTEKATVIWKSNMLNFWVHKSLTIQNINFDGSELFYKYSTDYDNNGWNLFSDKAYRKEQCCSCTAEGVCTRTGAGLCYCGAENLHINILTNAYWNKWVRDTLTANPDYVHHRPFFGLFNLEFLSDYSSASIPTLTMTGCTFKHFRYHDVAVSLLSLDSSYASKLTITSSSFENFFFPYGVITNAQMKWNRNLPYFSFNGLQDCTLVNPSLTKPCYLLTLEQNTFTISAKGYTYSKNPKNLPNTKYHDINVFNGKKEGLENEGIVLFLQSFPGHVRIYQNTFSKLVTVFRDSADGLQTANPTMDCLAKDDTDSAVKTDGTKKANVNYHVRKFLEKSNMKHSGSILNIRNLMEGLTLQENTFEDNVGYTGTGLFLHRWSKGGHSDWDLRPITIKSNIFRRNFALRIGLSIILSNYQDDLYSFSKNGLCGGILIDGNNFDDNVGCPKTIGNVIINCSPTSHTNMKKDFTIYDQDTEATPQIFASSLMNGQKAYLLQKEMVTWLETEATSYNTSSTKDSVDMNRVTITSNTFRRNYAILNTGIWLHGIPRLRIYSNTFQDNTIPLKYFVNLNSYKTSGYYVTLGKLPHFASDPSATPPVNMMDTTMENSALFISFSGAVDIDSCTFQNNTAGPFFIPPSGQLGNYDSGTNIGLAITFLQMIGPAPVSVTSCVFSNHKGIPTDLITDAADNYFYLKSEYTQQSLITFGFYSENMMISNFDWTSRSAPTTPKKEYSLTPSLEISSCTFTDNWFLINPSRSYTSALDRHAAIFSSISGQLSTIYDGRGLLNTGVFTNATVTNLNFTSCNIIQNKNKLFGNTGYHVIMDKASDSAPGIATFNHLYSNIRFTQSIGGAFKVNHNLFDSTKTIDDFLSAQPIVNLSDIYVTGAYSPGNPLFWMKTVSVFGMKNIYVEKSALIYNGVIYVESSTHMGNTRANTTINNITINGIVTQGVGCVYLTSSSYFKISDLSCIGITNYFFLPEFGLGGPLAGCFYAEKGSYNIFSNFTCKGTTLLQNTTSAVYLKTAKSACLTLSRETGTAFEFLQCLDLNSNGVNKQDSMFYLGYITNADNSKIISSNFTKNNLPGGIFLESSKNVAMKWDRFTSNSGGPLATCLHVVTQSSLYLSNSTLDSNICNGDSNIIVKDQAYLSVENSYFLSNTANNGATISTTMGTLILTSSWFISNIGLVGASAIIVKLGTSTMTYNYFVDNYGQQNCIWISESSVGFVSNNLLSNRAASRSSNLYIAEVESITIENCRFANKIGKTNNISETLVRGDFIYAYESGLTVLSSTFENSVANSAGAVYFTARVRNLSIINSTFTNNTANSNGGALYLDTTIQVTIVSSSFQNNTSFKQGSSIYLISSGILSLDACSFSTSVGLIVYLAYQSQAMILRTLFTGELNGVSNSAVHCDACTILFVSNSTFFKFWAQRGAGLLIAGRVDTNVTEDLSVYSQVSIYGSFFEYCQSSQGGAIYAEGRVYIDMKDTSSFNNSAFYVASRNVSGRGGAIYYTSSNDLSYFNISVGNKFEKNWAAISGGSLYFDMKSFKFLDSTTTFSNNAAPYGPDRAAYPVTLRILENPESSVYMEYVSLQDKKLSSKKNYQYYLDLSKIQSTTRRVLQSGELRTIASGQVIIPPLIFEIVDEYGQRVSTDNSSQATVKSLSSNITFSTQDSFTAYMGYYILYPFSLDRKPGLNASFYLESTAIKNLSYRPEIISTTAVPYSVYMRYCFKGEKLTDTKACTPCDPETYSFVDYTTLNSFETKTFCDKCPDGASCLGGYKMGPLKEYWRFGRNSNNFIKCKNDEACLGQYKTDGAEAATCKEFYPGDPKFCLTGWCAKGYQGNLCSECADGYAQNSEQEKTCSICSGNTNYYLKAVGISIAAVAFCIWTIRNSLKKQIKDNRKSGSTENPEYNYEKISNKEQSAEEPAENKEEEEKNKEFDRQIQEIEQREREDPEAADHSPIYIKILFNYIQIVSILGTFEFNWPSQAYSMFGINQQMVSSTQQFFSFDCLLKQDVFKNIGLRVFFTKLWLLSISPIAIMIILYVVWIIIFSIKYKGEMSKHKTLFKYNYMTSLVIMLFMVHPNIIQNSFASFSCSNLSSDDKPSIMLEVDNEIKCWEDEHLRLGLRVGVPSMLFWGLGIPVFAIIILFRKRDQLESEEMKRTMGFLYEGFNVKFFYWEFIILYRKLAIIFCSIFMGGLGLKIQAIFVLGVSSINFLFQKWFEPYEDDVLNALEERSLVASTFTLYCALIYLQRELNSQGVLALFGIIVIFNIYFFFFWLKEMLRQKSVEILKIKLMRKHCGCILFRLAKLRKYKKRNHDEPPESFNSDRVIILNKNKVVPMN